MYGTILFSFAEYPPKIFQCPGVNDKLNVGHYVLSIPCSLTVVCPRCKLCFSISILDWAVSDTGKTWSEHEQKYCDEWVSGQPSLWGNPSFSLCFDSTVVIPVTQSYIYTGFVVHPFWLWHIPSLCLVSLLCVTSKAYHIYSADLICVDPSLWLLFSCTNMWWINLEAVWLSCKCRDCRLMMYLSIMLTLVSAPLISFHYLLW